MRKPSKRRLCKQMDNTWPTSSHCTEIFKKIDIYIYQVYGHYRLVLSTRALEPVASQSQRFLIASTLGTYQKICRYIGKKNDLKRQSSKELDFCSLAHVPSMYCNQPPEGAIVRIGLHFRGAVRSSIFNYSLRFKRSWFLDKLPLVATQKTTACQSLQQKNL